MRCPHNLCRRTRTIPDLGIGPDLVVDVLKALLAQIGEFNPDLASN